MLSNVFCSGQGQLTVKDSSNRMLPRFQEPRLGYAKVPRIEEAIGSKNLLPSTALDPSVHTF